MNREYRQGIWISLIVLLVGCTSTPITKPTSKVPIALNPLVPKTIIHTGQAVTPPARIIGWKWNSDPKRRVTYWEYSFDLVNWKYGGWTTNTSVQFEPTNAACFFKFIALSNNVSLRLAKPYPPEFQ